jgi:hypothetical protein
LFKFINSVYQEYKRKAILEEDRYFFNKKNNYILFSGTLLGQNGDIRHVNDLYFIIYLFSYYHIPKENITLVVDKNILLEFNASPMYKDIYNFIISYTGEIIDVKEFESHYKRDQNKDLIFIASGHGNIDGLSIDQDQYLSPDYFEQISSATKATLLIMSQCFAGAFHHLDTRKNICVLGASEYQTSLSMSIDKLLNSDQVISLGDQNLNNFILNSLAFRPKIEINPFLFSFFITLLKPEIIKSPSKHMINVYKNTVAQTLNYLNDREKIFRIEQTFSIPQAATGAGMMQVLYDSNKSIVQQPYLLNKIIAARFQLLEFTN